MCEPIAHFTAPTRPDRTVSEKMGLEDASKAEWTAMVQIPSTLVKRGGICYIMLYPFWRCNIHLNITWTGYLLIFPGELWWIMVNYSTHAKKDTGFDSGLICRFPWCFFSGQHKVMSPPSFKWVISFIIPLSIDNRYITNQNHSYWQVGGFKHVWLFHFIYGMSSFPLANSIILQRGKSTTKQFC